jgi:hypothetical protein
VSHFDGRDWQRFQVSANGIVCGSLGGRQNAIPGARRRRSPCADAPERPTHDAVRRPESIRDRGRQSETSVR